MPQQTIDMPSTGEQAPDFEGPTQHDETIQLSDYRGRRVALYFYPKDDTPGCTKQACNLRDQYQTLVDNDIAVIGVSGDDIESHQQFAEKYDLPFPLVADPDHSILETYGVWAEKNTFGNTYMGTKRTTFLIDEEGTIRHIFKRPKTSAHAAEVLEKFSALDS